MYLDCLPENGVKCETEGGLPLKISGQLKAGEFSLPGNISSQFITGLLFALPLLPGDSRISLTSPLESSGYVDMTINTIKRFGVEIIKTPQGYEIPGGQSYSPTDYICEGDWSQAAFFMAGGALSGEVRIEGLNLSSAQGDMECIELFKRFGAVVEVGEGSVTVRKSQLYGIKSTQGRFPT